MIKSIFTKTKHILVGWYTYLFVNKSTPESKRRVKICMECPNKVKLGKDWVCSECLCIIKVKSLVEDETCLLNKW